MSKKMKIECVFCGRFMGTKDGKGAVGITSSICPDCLRKYYPNVAEQLLSE